MAGTKNGGRKTAETNKKLYGEDYYKKIGAEGGRKSRGGGFASKKIGKDGLTGAERARLVGRIGGLRSRLKNKEENYNFTTIEKYMQEKLAEAEREYEAWRKNRGLV
jgi:hypothetical protein